MIPAGCPLTEAQLEILSLIAVDALTYEQIALRRCQSGSAVRTHLTNAFHRLRVPNQTLAVVECLRNGWIIIPGLGSADALLLSRVERLLGELVEAIERRDECFALSTAQRAYLAAFVQWRHSREETEDAPCRLLALGRLEVVLREADLPGLPRDE